MENRILAALFFCLSLLFLQHAFLLDGTAARHNWVFSGHLTLYGLLAPLMYFHYYTMVSPDHVFPKRIYRYLSPTAFMSLSGITLIVDSIYGAAGLYRKVISGFAGEGDLYALPYKIFYVLAGIQILVLMAYLFYKLMRLLEKGYSSIFLTILMYIISTVVIIGIITAGFAFDHLGILKAGVFIGGILLILVPIYGQRHPEFVQVIATEAEKRRYERSLLGTLDLDSVITAMEKLMKEESLYREDTLTLKQMAEKLKITPHQLSEFLNEKMSCNFNTYINRYRVLEAEQLLKKDPERSILSVSYEVGFNSKSSFYEAFLKSTGKTPQKYRSDILGLNDDNNESN